MRLFPMITAALVVATLYLFVFEREKIFGFANRGEVATTEAEQESQAGETPQKSIVSVVALHSTASEVAAGVIVRGQTEAAREVDVRAETSGQVTSEPLRKGAQITEGQLLCQLDPGTLADRLAEVEARLAEALARVPEAEARLPEAVARLAEAQARVAEAQINLNAADRLSEGGFASETRVASANAGYESALAAVQGARSAVAGSDAGIESAKAGIQSAEAAVAAASRDIEKLAITAPFSGLLETDTAETGSFLQPGALCAKIIQLDRIKLVGFLPETEVSKVTLGAFAGARLATGTEVTGRVTFISKSADPNTRTFRVEVEVPNPDLAIRDGQTAEIGISSSGLNAHLLPLSSLTLNNDGTLGVRTVDATNHVEFNPVTVIRDTIDGIWVSGLPPQADIIIVGQEYVIAGVQVKATYQDAAQ